MQRRAQRIGLRCITRSIVTANLTSQSHSVYVFGDRSTDSSPRSSNDDPWVCRCHLSHYMAGVAGSRLVQLPGGAPRTYLGVDLGLIETEDRLGHCVVTAELD